MEEALYRVIQGTASPDEHARVHAWLTGANATENARQYAALAEVLRLATQLDASIETGPPPPPSLVIQEAEAESVQSSTSPYRDATRWLIRWGLPAAAVLALAFGLGDWIFQRTSRPAFGVEYFVSGRSEPVTLRLTDGTVVRLAPGSQLRAVQSDKERSVELEGRAYFSVSTVEDRPFRVRTRAGDIRVLGTRFQVETGGNELRLVVVQGRVSLAGSRHEVEVGAGQMSRLRDGIPSHAVFVPDLRPMTDWVGNFLAFQSTPLRDAMDEIADRFDVQYEITDSILAQRTLTMWFTDDRELSEVMAVVCAVIDARCQIESNVITIDRQ